MSRVVLSGLAKNELTASPMVMRGSSKEPNATYSIPVSFPALQITTTRMMMRFTFKPQVPGTLSLKQL
jgi:hypothetical protein